jgi:hypothetical protein
VGRTAVRVPRFCVLEWGEGDRVNDTTDLLVFLAVVGLRLFVPLLIPRFPLPAVLACLVIDGVDQSIFQKYTDLDLTDYQSYDKALDIYYLSIAYLSTFRNWENLFAFEGSRFLYYYRLVGVALFEITHLRAVLLFFPNTFEYFFIFYEAVRLRWNPARMGTALVIGAGSFIWIFIKVPQEYWIHIAQRDVTDTLREYPWLIPLIAVAIVAILVAAWWIITKRCPPADRRISFVVNDPFGDAQFRQMNTAVQSRRIFDLALLEKIVLVGLVCFIFSKILPEVDASGLQIGIAVGVLITLNTVVSEWLARRGMDWQSIGTEFVAMAVVNAGLAFAMWLILQTTDGSIHLGNTLFFLLLITLMITLYDRFQPYYLIRRALAEQERSATS